MKKMMLMGVILPCLCGCMTTAEQMVAPRSDLSVGDRFDLDSRELAVDQVCGNGVHVYHEDRSAGGLRIAVIPLVNDYVTGTFLRSGIYEYVGPYTYRTVKDANGNSCSNTIRLFKEVWKGAVR